LIHTAQISASKQQSQEILVLKAKFEPNQDYGDVTIMFLFIAPTQDDLTFADVLHHWHRDALAFVHKDLPQMLVVFAVAFVLIRIVAFFVNRMRRLADQHVANPQRASELRTVASILRATAYGIIGFIVLLHALSVLGINLTPLLASAGVVGVGIGLGAQSLFKDMLNGIFILIENQYNVGDTVKLASLAGTVEDLSLRLTTLRDSDGTLYFIPNSQIATVSNLSRDFSVATLSLTVDATADPDKVVRVLRATALAVRHDPAFKNVAVSDPDVPGVDAISGRVVTYPVSIRVSVNQKDALLRELRRRILQAFEENAIPLGTDPANMLLMHHADPTAPPAQQPLTSA
jgi:moderate conductance mechanosensitive channel